MLGPPVGEQPGRGQFGQREVGDDVLVTDPEQGQYQRGDQAGIEGILAGTRVLASIQTAITGGDGFNPIADINVNPSNPEIDPGSQDGQLTTARDETEESCLSGGPGWKHYEKRDATNGDRAVGITACLTSESIKGGTGTDKNIRLPGYQWAQKEAWKTGRKSWDAINNCHLLGKGLGGSGTDLDNLSTCSREANADSMDNSPNLARNMDYYEDLARKAVTIDKQAVYYTVTPKYAGGRTVPYGYQMTARGVNRDGSPGLKFDDIVYNEMYDRKRKWAFNLGYRLDGDLKPVPVGGTP